MRVTSADCNPSATRPEKVGRGSDRDTELGNVPATHEKFMTGYILGYLDKC